MKTLRLVLAEDHQMTRGMLRSLIDSQPDMQVVREAATGIAALEQVRSLDSDFVGMDLPMPVMNGVQATELFQAERPEVLVLALTSHEGMMFYSFL
jgi:two-component system nitrate/nitrite response regulator NarL